MAYLEMRDVSFSYKNGYQALDNVNLEVNLGESVAIIGQNGAGKTTAVKLLNGLLKPSVGEVYLQGKPTKKLTTAQMAKFVGYAFQNPDDQIFQETIYREIAYGLPKKMSKEQRDQIVFEAAKICGLDHFLNEHPYNLPYSKRKFITIAAIIALDPQVVILDEPTAGQDRSSTKRIGDIIDYLVAKKKAVITITHDMEFVVSQFERVVVFANKKKRKEGKPNEIFWDDELLKLAKLKKPYIAQVASLLGYQNINTIDELLQRRFG